MRNFEYDHTTAASRSAATEDRSRPGWMGPLDAFDSLVVVSNREPYRHTYGDDGSIAVDRPTGGLTAALDPVLERVGGTWIAWGDGEADDVVVDANDRVRVPPDDPAYTLERIWLDDEEVDAYYHGYSNQLLWPVSHGILDVAKIRPGDFEGYRTINERFAERVTSHVTSETLVWLQDYHLALAPSMIRDRASSAPTIGQFWHIPWPEPEAFNRIPQGRELLQGLLGADVLGFHVDRFADRFLSCVEYFLDDATVDHDASTVAYDGSRTHVTAIPLGIDAEKHADVSRDAGEAGFESITKELSIPETPALGLGVDRLDYTKGIRERIEAIERLLEERPERIGSFTFVQKATPSRTDIPAYAEYGRSVREAVDRVTDRFATEDWQPIVYTEEYLSREQLCALYRHADLMLVTSLADGMNLVAKEYLASSVDDSGALCLSERAGAHDELGEDVYSVDPTDTDAIARTVDDVLAAPERERRSRMRSLRGQVLDRTLEWWMGHQFETFAAHKRTEPVLSPWSAGDRA